jgi:hypothetical protein
MQVDGAGHDEAVRKLSGLNVGPAFCFSPKGSRALRPTPPLCLSWPETESETTTKVQAKMYVSPPYRVYAKMPCSIVAEYCLAELKAARHSSQPDP